jgi:mono/diheme cytochrome c family protein
MMIGTSKRSVALGALGGLALLAVTGCAPLTARAPLVTPELAMVAATRGIDAAAAARGRDLYVGACARCHGPVAVRSRTPAQWREILPRMADKTQLEAAATRDLSAYLSLMEAGAPDAR